MNFSRAAILLWLILPIPVFGLIRRWYVLQVRKYPSTTPGKIVGIISQEYYSSEYATGVDTRFTYAFSTKGIEYTGQGKLGGKHETGEEVRIRYNPNKPEESRLDNLRDIAGGWIIAGISIGAFNLGYCFISICIGLLLFAGGMKSLRKRPVEWAKWKPAFTFLASAMCILLGVVLIATPVLGLMKNGFLEQNLLWKFWNH